MGQVLLQWNRYLEQGAVLTGADAMELLCHSLGDNVSTAGSLKSVYSMQGHINPITTNLVIMVFIEAGAFSIQFNTHTFFSYITHSQTMPNTGSHADPHTLVMITQHYIRSLRDATLTALSLPTAICCTLSPGISASSCGNAASVDTSLDEQKVYVYTCTLHLYCNI